MKILFISLAILISAFSFTSCDVSETRYTYKLDEAAYGDPNVEVVYDLGNESWFKLAGIDIGREKSEWLPVKRQDDIKYLNDMSSGSENPDLYFLNGVEHRRGIFLKKETSK